MRINRHYTCIKDFIKSDKYIIYELPKGSSFYCTEVIEGIIRVVVTKNSSLYLTINEFEIYFNCLSQIRRKKLETLKKHLIDESKM